MNDPSTSLSRADEASRVSTYPSVLVGLVGTGIQASRTPRLHEREGAEQGLRYIYKLIDLETLGLDAGALPEILNAAQRFGFAGLNITHPCKQAVIPLLDELSPDAAALGAVNTVVLEDDRRVGHNTDWWGFAESFRRELSDVRIDRVVQFGAGGAGAAVAHALLTLGAGEITIIDTDEVRARSLASALCERFGK
ncbi:MAG: shikimate dehydrogenase, partial [Microvirga sp.]